MASTAVTLTLTQGILVPSQSSVPFVNGDSVSFSTSDGSPGFLFFSPDAAAALSPGPITPYALAGSNAEFTFISSDPGQYSVYFETDASVVPPPFPPGASSLLLLETDSGDPGSGGVTGGGPEPSPPAPAPFPEPSGGLEGGPDDQIRR